MSRIKRILLLVAILTIWTGHQAFAAVQKTPDQKEPGGTSSSPSTAPGETGKTFNEPKDQSILNRLPAPPPTDNPEPTNPTDTNNPPPQNPPYNPPNYPQPTYPSYVSPIDNICPQGYYCRANLMPVLGAREGVQKLCTRNETELEDAYRDCDKVIELCQKAKPSIMSEAQYQRICS